MTTINQLEQTSYWKDMAILIAWDDSDGWYDHVLAPVVSPSNDPSNDALAGAGLCGTPQPGAYLDRCGYGPRLPFLAISPFSKKNYVSHQEADQSSILRFIENNWQTGQIGNQSFDAIAGSFIDVFDFSHPNSWILLLNPTTGEGMQ